MTCAARLTGQHWQTGAPVALEVQGGRIARVAPCEDAEPGILAPGLVDLQVNGYGGHDLNDGALSAATVSDLCRALAPLGIAAFLPTVITAGQGAMCDAMAAIRAAREADPLARAMIAGIHVEGPAVSPEDGPRGAHPAAHVRAPSMDDAAGWQEASGGLVRMLTLAPEWPGAPAVIRALAEAGVVVALGHTAATGEQVHAAAEAGAQVSTHLGNGAAAMLPRHPNHIWAQLADDRLTATLIADGHHLPADTFRVMLRAKGAERVALVSDSVALAGMPPGRYRSTIGGDVEVSADGRVSMAGTVYLAGAGLPLIACLGRAMEMAGLSLAEVLPLATATPGRLIGRRAVLEPGAPADVIRLAGDASPEVAEAWIGGERVAP